MTLDLALSCPTPTAPTLVDVSEDPISAELERRNRQRAALKSRHSQGLTTLMGQRVDLRGVHALADFVDESVRWTA